MRFFMTQILFAAAVILGVGGLGAMVRFGEFAVEIERLQSPSNADIAPLESASLGWFLMAPLMMLGALFVSGIGARRLGHRRSLFLSLVVWTAALMWLSASLATGLQGQMRPPAEIIGNAYSMLGGWFVIPPLVIAPCVFLLMRLERQAEA